MQGSGNPKESRQSGNGDRDQARESGEELDTELSRTKEELSACQGKLALREQTIAKLKEELDRLKQQNSPGGKAAALEELTADYQKAQEMATMGSWVLDTESGKVTWTPELHRIFGQDPSCPVPDLEEQKTWYTQESYELMLKAANRMIENGSPYNVELEIIRRDGSRGMVRSIGEAERDENGRVVRLRGVAQDISELKQKEAELKYALEQERAAKIYKDQFLANMSHEIRTPMNGVVGFASLLREEGLDPETRDDYIRTIESCSNQLLNLIDDIIDVAKIEAGEIKIQEKSFSLARLTQDTAKTVETIRSEKNKEHIFLKTHIPGDAETLELYSDPLRLQQILINLLSNALKFSHEGTIEFGYRFQDDILELYVKDEGIGIEPERKELIFERFEHLEGTTTKYEGTGLGLSISKGLSEILGMKLEVESELGVGSTFRLKIPHRCIVTPNHRQAAPTPAAEKKEGKPTTILVVEDEAMNQKFIERVLRSTGFTAVYAYDGEQAVEAYQKHPEIDVVLMDIRMPIMNGDAAAREILQIDSNAKVIAQTAYAMQEECEKFLQDGFVDYISKPYKPEELARILKKWT